MNAKINLDVLLLSYAFKEGINHLFYVIFDLCVAEVLLSIAKVIFLMLLQ
jgi:hypothetical protein